MNLMDLVRALRDGEGELALAMVVLLGLTPEQFDRVIKISRLREEMIEIEKELERLIMLKASMMEAEKEEA